MTVEETITKVDEALDVFGAVCSAEGDSKSKGEGYLRERLNVLAAVREAMLAAFRLGVSSVGVSRASAPDCIAENEALIQALGERTVDTDPGT